MLWPALASRALFRPFHNVRTSAALHAIASAALPIEKAIDTVAESSTTLSAPLIRPSKASFAAAQAIRMCIANGGFSDGFFVLNSIRFASYRQKVSNIPFKAPGIAESQSEFEAAALSFGPDVPTRLSAHTLLHCLVRHNIAQPAFELSKLMMQEGVNLRSATLEAIMKSLVPPPTNRTLLDRIIPRQMRTIPLQTPSDALLLHPSRMSDPRTRFALELLFLARRHRQRRTDHMFKLIMAASLLKGELIIFSLLFGWTCREWQTGYSLSSNIAALPEDDELQSSPQVASAKLRLEHLRKEAIFPDRTSLENALQIIKAILARDGDATYPTQDRLVALQSLANIAGLLERHQIPFPKLSVLISTLYKCPRVDDEVWIVGLGGCPERIKAYDYFHQVLLKLLQTLPTQQILLQQPMVPRDAIVKSRRYPLLPPLDVSSCNSLLHYALRQRLSIEYAQKILSHMASRPDCRNSPDIVTANILLRSGSLLRRNDIVSGTVQSMGPHFSYTPDVPVMRSDGSFKPKVSISTTPAISSLGQEQFGFVQDALDTGARLGAIEYGNLTIPALPSAGDIRTLTSYISHLTAIGKPGEVTTILFTVLPELQSILFPTNSERKEDQSLGHAALLASLRRAITLGPIFFGAVLDSLSKSGQFALADRVWQLAKKAEWCSWTRAHVPQCEPWIFGPHVYTIMMRCYGTLARRRELWQMKLHPAKRISKRTSKHSVWASFLYECQQLPHPMPPHQVFFLLRRVMAHATFDVFQRFMSIATLYRRLPTKLRWLKESELPRPDARFFNAALDVFRPRANGPGAGPWIHALKEAQQALAETHRIPSNEDWNVPLEAVVKAMVKAGFPLPVSLQSISVGRLDAVMQKKKGHKPASNLDVPFVYADTKPDGGVVRPLHLPTPKHKALPTSPAYNHYRRLRMRRWIQRQQRRQPAKWQRRLAGDLFQNTS
ncbi:hypothetical protein MIND_00694400 [Mycena indigotica]|uniref:Uncharacterized protein n=1 Tax=Mycena indigotica TaxID=2126181 RepID=A0A8H6SL12_9AGAR|nr:uncharacterized protein MIND_00694400 [Mycena indigotica]KAF7301294.1 hypothetical protein MIND_00694400 [Mycena indigotica]